MFSESRFLSSRGCVRRIYCELSVLDDPQFVGFTSTASVLSVLWMVMCTSILSTGLLSTY